MSGLLGASEIRDIAQRIGVTPTKKLGQNFVVDANTCRRIVKSADVNEHDIALEIDRMIMEDLFGVDQSKVYILAPNMNEANRSMGANKNRYIILNRPEQLLGTINPEVIITPNAYQRPDYEDFMDMIRTRKLTSS